MSWLGTLEQVGGTVAFVAGTVMTATGVGSAAGVPLMVAGMAVMANGTMRNKEEIADARVEAAEASAKKATTALNEVTQGVTQGKQQGVDQGHATTDYKTESSHDKVQSVPPNDKPDVKEIMSQARAQEAPTQALECRPQQRVRPMQYHRFVVQQ